MKLRTVIALDRFLAVRESITTDFNEKDALRALRWELHQEIQATKNPAPIIEAVEIKDTNERPSGNQPGEPVQASPA